MCVPGAGSSACRGGSWRFGGRDFRCLGALPGLRLRSLCSLPERCPFRDDRPEFDPDSLYECNVMSKAVDGRKGVGDAPPERLVLPINPLCDAFELFVQQTDLAF
jgi:hypothetical protein